MKKDGEIVPVLKFLPDLAAEDGAVLSFSAIDVVLL